jgi:hypothetical protein
MQTSVVALDRIEPCPLVDRLCLFEGDETGTWAVAVIGNVTAVATKSSGGATLATEPLTAPP